MSGLPWDTKFGIGQPRGALRVLVQVLPPPGLASVPEEPSVTQNDDAHVEEDPVQGAPVNADTEMSEDVTTFMQPDCTDAADVLPLAERRHDWQKNDARAKRLKPSDETNVVPSAISGSNHVVAHVQLSPPVHPKVRHDHT